MIDCAVVLVLADEPQDLRRREVGRRAAMMANGGSRDDESGVQEAESSFLDFKRVPMDQTRCQYYECYIRLKIIVRVSNRFEPLYMSVMVEH